MYQMRERLNGVAARRGQAADPDRFLASLISISAMPDSCSSSISFLIFRMSM